MSEKEFQEQYALASALVKSWPVWKQNILQNSSKPTVAVAREPVDNARIAEEHAKKTPCDD